MSEVAAASVATAPTPATPTTTPTKINDGKTEDNNSKTTTTTNATNAENEMTERNVPVNDPPVTGASSMQMPPLVVKQRGVAKPGVQPTAGSVSFDYTGPPVKVTNGTVLDLVTQFGIPNAWLAVLKLKGFNVNKESAEALMPIKRFRDRVRKLKQTAETLKSRSDDSATFLAKEFVCALNNVDSGSSNAKPNAQSGSNQKESSSTDAVIESILRQAATEVKANSTNAAPTKPKRKKNNTQKQALPPSNAGPGSSHPNSTIDDVVSSVMNKIRNNEPFEGEDRNNGEVSFANVELPFNSVQQQPHQQMVFAPNLQPGQTIYMVQDESMIPLLQQQQQPQQILQPPPTATSPFKGKAKGRKSKAAAAAAASQPSGSQIPQQQVVQIPNYLQQQQQIAPSIRSPTSQSMPQQVTVLTVPRNQNGAGNTSYSIPAGYSTAKFDNNTTVIFSNINDLIRAQQTPGVNNQQNQMAKVVTYQPGMTLPPGATIMSNANPQGMSPSYQQIVTHQQPQQSMQPQYVVTQAPAPQLSSSPPKPQPQSAADDKGGEGSNKKSPRRKSIKTAKREDVALSNFNDSDFEELASPKRKDASKKVPKKEKKEPAEKKPKAAAAAPAAAPASQPKTPAKKGRKRKAEAPESEHEEEEADHTEVESSDVEENKSQLEREVAQLKRQLQAERSRHYTQKRRATKLDDDYKRVLDRLQQTELNLALQMSECERLQAELKKMGDENDNLTAKAEGNDAPKNVAKPTRPASKRSSVINKKRASPSPSPTPGTSQKKTPKGKAATTAKASTAAASSTASTSSPSTNNRKRGRPSTNAATNESSTDNKQSSPSPTTANEEDKPAFNPNDFIPRRAAAAKRIRYF